MIQVRLRNDRITEKYQEFLTDLVATTSVEFPYWCYQERVKQDKYWCYQERVKQRGGKTAFFESENVNTIFTCYSEGCNFHNTFSCAAIESIFGTE